MTLDDFYTLTQGRIPTATEFLAFVRSMGWSVRKTATSAALRAPTSNPVAIALAKMLSREPYRTKVLDLLAHPGVATDAPDTGAPETPGEPGGPAMTESLACRACGVCWELAATTADKALLCDRILTCPEKKRVDWGTIPSHSITGGC